MNIPDIAKRGLKYPLVHFLHWLALNKKFYIKLHEKQYVYLDLFALNGYAFALILCSQVASTVFLLANGVLPLANSNLCLHRKRY